MRPTDTRTEAFRIRPATMSDLEILVHGNRAMARETESRELDLQTVTHGVRRLLEDPSKGRYFVALIGDRIAGQLMLTREWSDWRDGDFWWIQSVYVEPDCRRQGVFAALFKHVEAEALADKSVCGLRLYVDHDNQRAQQAYRNLGATTTDYALMEWEFR